MNPRTAATAAGLALYLGLVVGFFAIHRATFGDGGGPYPVWYTVAELVFTSAKAIVPGLAVGWLCRPNCLHIGAAVGAVGGVVEVVLLGAFTGVSFGQFPGRMLVATLSTSLVSAATNAVGAAAGAYLRGRGNPSHS